MESKSFQPKFLDKFGIYLDTFLEKFFGKWGTVFAKNPVIVILAGSWPIAILIYGAFSLTITTEPNEIWASPTSQSRIEKDYFDSR